MTNHEGVIGAFLILQSDEKINTELLDVKQKNFSLVGKAMN